jgi:hypothetical protein
MANCLAEWIGYPHQPVSIANPKEGQPCFGSPLVLGYGNLGQAGAAGTIVNIDGFVNLANAEVYGWYYTTNSGAYYFQRNSNDVGDVAGVIGQILKNIPGISSIWNALQNSATRPYKISPQQLNNIEQGFGQSPYSDVTCFTNNLPMVIFR